MTYSFNKNATQRIVSTVKAFERQPKNTIPPRNHGGGDDGGSKGFFAKLTSQSDGKYSFDEVYTDKNTGKMKVKPNGKTGDKSKPKGWAYEAMTFSEHCCINDVVWLTPNKVESGGVNGYWFNYAGVAKTGQMPSTDIGAGAKGQVTINFYNGDSVTKSDQSVEARNDMAVKATKNKKCYLTFDYGWKITGVSC